LAAAIMQPAEQCYTGFDQAFARNGVEDRQSEKGQKRKHRRKRPTSHARQSVQHYPKQGTMPFLREKRRLDMRLKKVRIYAENVE